MDDCGSIQGVNGRRIVDTPGIGTSLPSLYTFFYFYFYFSLKSGVMVNRFITCTIGARPQPVT